MDNLRESPSPDEFADLRIRSRSRLRSARSQPPRRVHRGGNGVFISSLNGESCETPRRAWRKPLRGLWDGPPYSFAVTCRTAPRDSNSYDTAARIVAAYAL